jgi:PAS domain S-box-containing protein
VQHTLNVAEKSLPRLRLCLPPEPSRLLRARERVRDYLEQHGCAGRPVDQIVLAIEEACTNAVRHSGSGDDIEVDLAFDEGDLTVVVRDHGRGFEVAAFDPERRPELLASGGRGLFMIAHLVDEMALESDGGVTVRMVMRGILTADRQAPLIASGPADMRQALDSRSDARQRVVLEEIDEGFAALDWEFRCVYVNGLAQQLLDATREQLVGRVLWEVFPQIGGSPLGEACRAAMELGRPAILEHLAKTGDWYEVRVYPTPSGISLLFSRINDRKRIEEERERFFDMSVDILAIASVSDGRWRRVSAAMTETLGWSESELLGAPFLDMVHPDDLERSRDAVASLAAGRPLAAFEHRVRCRDGGYRWITWNSAPSPDGEVIYCVGRDTTERRRFEQELLEREERFRVALDRVPDVVGIYDRDLRFRYINSAILSTTGRPPADYLGRRDEEIWPPEVAALWVPTLRAAFATGESQRVAIDFPSPIGEFYLDIVFVPLFEGEDGRPSEVMVISHDYTERWQAEEALRRRAEEIERIMEVTPAAIWVASDPGCTEIVGNRRANEFYEAAGGENVSASTVPERRQFFAGGRELSAEELPMQYAAATDSDVRDAELEVVLPSGRRLWMLGNASPLRDDSGAVRGCVGAFVNIDERKEAEEQLRRSRRRAELLARTVSTLLSSDEPQRVIEDLCREVMVEVGCDVFFNFLADEEHDCLRLNAYAGIPDDEARRIELLEYGVAVCGCAARDAVPIVVRDIQHSGDERAALVASYGVQAYAAHPLISHGEVLGTLSFGARSRDGFTDDELALMKAVTDHVAIAIERRRAEDQLRHIATVLQENLVHPLPHVAGLELGAMSRPSLVPELVGGDFYDVFQLPDGLVVAVIGDVMGKGVKAAGLTETVRSTIRAFASIDWSPAFILRKTNDLLLAQGGGEEIVTALLLTLDVASGHVSYASAGHPGPVRLSALSCELVEPAYGLPLGSLKQEFASDHLRLTPDDCLVLFTDGVTEARRDGELFGEERLLDTVNGMRGEAPQRVAEAVGEAARAFALELRDDLQVLALRLR